MMKEFKEGAIGLAVMVALLILVFALGYFTGRDVTERGESVDTLVVRDTLRIPSEVLQTQVVTQEVVRYKYVPLMLTDTVVKTDTVVRVEDGVAVIPISMKTYTDSSTYKAVVSGYDPRLESIEVYQENTVITRTLESPRWSICVQGGVYMTPAGVQPGIGVGIGYRLW